MKKKKGILMIIDMFAPCNSQVGPSFPMYNIEKEILCFEKYYGNVFYKQWFGWKWKKDIIPWWESWHLSGQIDMFDFMVLMLKSGLHENEFLNIFKVIFWFRLDWIGINK